MSQALDEANLFDFIVKKGNGVKGLVDLGIKEVPNLYIRPPHERFDKSRHPSSTSDFLVPIDLSKLNGPRHHEVVDAIVRASERLGFFQVINHGFDLEHLESLKAAAHRFFEQPMEAKAVYLKGVSPTPFVKYTTSFSPEKEKVLEWKDHINIIYTNDDDAEKFWPKACKDEILEYMKSANKTVNQLFTILIENLGVKVDDSLIESLVGFKVVNMNYYPACPNPELTIGASRHSDMGVLTVLLQDDIGGLYVKIDEDIAAGKKEEWIEVPPVPGALVVNIGDTLQVLSNGKYKSAEHKVVTTSDRSRVSIPHFVAPRPMVKVGPLPEVVEKAAGGALYREYAYHEYMKNFFGHAHEGKNALDFAKINYVA